MCWLGQKRNQVHTKEQQGRTWEQLKQHKGLAGLELSEIPFKISGKQTGAHCFLRLGPAVRGNFLQQFPKLGTRAGLWKHSWPFPGQRNLRSSTLLPAAHQAGQRLPQKLLQAVAMKLSFLQLLKHPAYSWNFHRWIEAFDVPYKARMTYKEWLMWAGFPDIPGLCPI